MTLPNIVQYQYGSSIPQHLLDGFNKQAQAYPKYIEQVKKSDVMLVANLETSIGFVTGSYHTYDCPGREWDGRKILAINGFYVEPAWQRRGIGTSMLHRIIIRARQEKIAGISLEKMTFSSEDLMYKLKAKHKRNTWLDVGFTYTETHICADIWFKDRLRQA